MWAFKKTKSATISTTWCADGLAVCQRMSGRLSMREEVEPMNVRSGAVQSGHREDDPGV